MNDQQRIETAADNCEVLRERLARYEDADGVPFAKQPSGVVLPELNKSRERWARVDARVCAHNNSTAANMHLIQDAQKDIERLHRALDEVALLNSSPVSAGDPCDHEWIDDGQYLLVCTSCGAKEDHDPRWRDMATAPRDGTMLRLLVEFTEHSTEDADQAPTIGANNFDNDGEDRWQFAGWCWSHDHFVEGKGEPVGWLPMIEARAVFSAPSHGEQVRHMVPDEVLNLLKRARVFVEDWDDDSQEFMDLCGDIDNALAAASSAGSQEQGE